MICSILHSDWSVFYVLASNWTKLLPVECSLLSDKPEWTPPAAAHWLSVDFYIVVGLTLTKWNAHDQHCQASNSELHLQLLTDFLIVLLTFLHSCRVDFNQALSPAAADWLSSCCCSYLCTGNRFLVVIYSSVSLMVYYIYRSTCNQ